MKILFLLFFVLADFPQKLFAKNTLSQYLTSNYNFLFPVKGVFYEMEKKLVFLSEQPQEIINISNGKVIHIVYDNLYNSYIVFVMHDNYIAVYVGLDTVNVKLNEHITYNTNLGTMHKYQNSTYICYFLAINTKTDKYINALEYIRSNYQKVYSYEIS